MNRYTLILFSLLILSLSSCKDDKSDYEIPTTYNFTNVSYQGQLDRLGMLAEMKSYLNTTTDDNSSLDAARLIAMYENSNPAVTNWSGTYGETKQLKNKTNTAAQTTFENLLLAAAADSQNNGVASEGTAGVLTSLDGEKKYFVNAKGIEYTQVIEKGLMGACLLHQATAIYLEPGKMDVDNTTIIEGEGTEMEHHWDESFGYFGVPIDFPTNTTGVVFWGDYCNDRDELIATNSPIMDAYIKGRAAISNNDLSTRDEEITNIRTNWDRVVAGTALHYINSGITNYNDMAKRAHALSEAVAFTYSVTFNPDAVLTTNQSNDILNLIGGNTDFQNMDLYNVSISDLENARDQLASIYNWTSIKEQF